MSGKELFVYKQEKAPAVLLVVLSERGWVEFDSSQHSPQSWSLLWKTPRLKPSEYATSLPYQRVNHFPKTSLLCTKDSLARTLRTMKAIYGRAYYFSPVTFILPGEYSKFLQECMKRETLWICKPADLSRGRKIFLFKDIKELKYDQQVIVQRYMKNPLLIGQYKWDMRVYVLVTCYHPLTIYLYREGLARFSSSKFDLSDLQNKYSHLTNSSINKFSPSHNVHKAVIGAGCKWTFQQLNFHLAGMGVDVDSLWSEIKKIIVLTLLAIASEVPNVASCFELFGFDVIVDDCGKPWLLEVNSSPALSVENEVDAVIKTQLLNDTLDVLSFTHPAVYLSHLTQSSPSRRAIVPSARLQSRCKFVSMSPVKFPPLASRLPTVKTGSPSRLKLRTSLETSTICTRMDSTEEDEEREFLSEVRKNMKNVKSYDNPTGDAEDGQTAESDTMDSHLRRIVEELTRTRPVPASHPRPATCGHYELICPLSSDSERNLLLLRQGVTLAQAGEAIRLCVSSILREQEA